ncbi:MAG: tetratricopeptide repeat protein [Luminiphilus sp.]|nr:tetratricopeptide repeat protein [Luminiphilus sp.]
MTRLRLLILCLFSLLLTSCASQPSDTQPAAVNADVDSPRDLSESIQPETPIPDTSVRPLLEAEFALRARDFEHGLALMADQAAILRDPLLARRALRLAEFVNDADRATAMSMRLAELAPSDGAAAAAASGWLTRTGNPLLALHYASLAIKLGAQVNVAANLGGYEQLAQNTQEELARKIYDLAERWPEDDQTAIAASLLCRLENNPSRAEAFLSPVLERDPENIRAVMLWTQLQLDQSAASPFQRLADTLVAFPQNQELRLQYARLLGAEGDYDAARHEFSILLEQEPDNPELLATAAILDFELQYFDEALEKLEYLIMLEERLNEAYYYKGRIAMMRDEYSEAIAAFAAVGPSREFSDAKSRAAQLLVDSAFASDIKSFFSAQRQRYPTSAEQLFLLEADALKDWTGESLRAYDRGLTAFPHSFSLLYGRAMAHEAAGYFTEMEQDLRGILAQDPDHAATLNALGYTLTNHTGRFEEAAKLIERALELSPGDPAIMDSLGWVYYKLGHFEQSESLLRRAHLAFPDPEVAAHLGEVLWVQGRQIEARDIWQEGLSRVPEHPIILEAIGRLGADLP